MKPPTYITMIRDNEIYLKSLCKGTKIKLKENAIDISTKYLVDKVIPIKENKNELLIKLNDLGLIFGEDYKQGWSPADIMRDLQDKEELSGSFKSIYWVGQDQWKLKDNKKEKK